MASKVESEIYWYESPEEVLIGTRGGSEFKMKRDQFMKLYLRHEKTMYNRQTRGLNLQEVLRLMMVESQYVEFEEIKPEPLQLT